MTFNLIFNSLIKWIINNNDRKEDLYLDSRYKRVRHHRHQPPKYIKILQKK